MEGAAAGYSFGNIWGFVEGESRRVLDGHRRGGPDLAADAQQPVAQAVPGRAVGQPGHADPPAAEGEALAERGRDHRPLRREGGRARERCAGVVHQVAVDLVGDDDQVVGRGDVAEFAHGARAGEPAGRVVRQRDDHRADPPAVLARRLDGPGEPVRVADAALPGRCGHEMRADTDHAGLGGVADPAWPGHGDVRADGEQQAEQQRLAAWPADHRVGAGRQAAPGPVARRGLAQGGQPGHGAVGVAVAGRGQCGAQHRMGGQAGLAEGEREHRLAAEPPDGERFVGGQGGRDRDRCGQRGREARCGRRGVVGAGVVGAVRRPTCVQDWSSVRDVRRLSCPGPEWRLVRADGRHGCISHGHGLSSLLRGLGRRTAPWSGGASKSASGHSDQLALTDALAQASIPVVEVKLT